MVKKQSYIIFILAVIATAVLTYIIVSTYTQKPQECPPQNCTPQMPKQKLADVKSFIGRVMDSYSDLPFAERATPRFLPEEGVWEEVVLLNRTGSAKLVRIRVYDSNLTLQGVFVEGPKPISLSNDEVVAKGVVKMAGKLNCSQEKIRALVFFDLYCPPCIAGEEKIAQLKEKFNRSVSFEYKIILTHSYDLAPKYGLENVSLAAGYLLCSRAQGKLEEFKKCAIEKYMTHEEVPLTPMELSECANSTSLNATAFDECIKTYYVNLNLDRMAAETYGLVGSLTTIPAGAPVVVVDCMYKAEVNYAEAAICYAHPELEECKS
ncbi:MAG: hypothetical protein QXF56_00700 [Candidatus Micrarchaeia archaeon]